MIADRVQLAQNKRQHGEDVESKNTQDGHHLVGRRPCLFFQLGG